MNALQIYQKIITFIDGSAGDGSTVGKCTNNLKCLSSGECRVCKVINGNHEGCSGSTPYCDEAVNPPVCSKYYVKRDDRNV